MKEFLSAAQYQDNPLATLVGFLKQEDANEQGKQYDKLRFVGYVLDIGFDTARIITSDPFKQAVGGIPRGSFLIMVPAISTNTAPHFTLLRVEDVAPTPLGSQVQQTYFELHKKSMPELDVWTQSELQWGALNTRLLGMYYPDANDTRKLAFSGDVNTLVSAHRYRVYAPDEKLLDLIVNGTVRADYQVQLGDLRVTECQLPVSVAQLPSVPVKVSMRDFMGFRTAMFGKTRLGKSNVVKLIAQAIMNATKESKSVGQLIFDINGEYANDNPQDDSLSIRSANEKRCVVYSIAKREKTPSRPLKLNFYERPDSCMSILAGLLEESNQNAQYVRAFAAVQLPSISDIPSLKANEQIRAVRKIQIYWAILYKAGFAVDESRLKGIGLRAGKNTRDFDPGLSENLRRAALGVPANARLPKSPDSLSGLRSEAESVIDFVRTNPGHSTLRTASGNDLWDADDLSLLSFLKPTIGGGPITLRPFITYHDANASDVVTEVITLLDEGQTVILDLGNANDRIRRYFSDLLSREVFSHQEHKFTSDKLGSHFVQLYFEEAHNLFPRTVTDLSDVYSRFAKEGAKFHIGIVYSTQSPSTISQELLAQTENFFVGHLASQDEARALGKVQVTYEGVEKDILHSRTPGYMRMLTFSHRFVVPMQAFKFEAVSQKAA